MLFQNVVASRMLLQQLSRNAPGRLAARSRPASLPGSNARLFSQTRPRPATYRRFGDDLASRAGRGYGNDFKSRVRNLPPVVYVAGGAGGVYYIYHLERTETGRLRFFDVTEASEREMGEMAAQEILQQYSRQILPDNHPTTKYVRKVADRILAASGLDTRTHGNAALTEVSDAWGSSNKKEGVNWKVRVIKDDSTKNAFVLPNGAIFVFTGILPVCANEDGLAAVLGHEVAHQVARHAGERMSSQKINLALSFLASFLGIDPSLTSPAIGLMLTLPNSRAAETEADHIGLKLASRACYNPAEAAQMWERMKQSESGSGGGGGASIDFLSTHPANEKRIQQIREWLPEANRIREDSCGTLAEQKSLFSQATMSPWR